MSKLTITAETDNIRKKLKEQKILINKLLK